MKLKTSRKALVLAMGTAMTFMAPLALAADTNPFAATEMSSGYMQLAGAEGKCGEGKCGEGKKAEGEGKCGEGKKAEGEGKCGEGKKAEGEGKCGESKKGKSEGKCGEGKCGN